MTGEDSGRIERIGSREVYASPWLRLREDDVRFPDGSTGQYAVVDKPDFVLVLPFEGGGFWIVQQYRYAVGSREWEFPQGGWSAGSSGSMDELAAAELAEETGLRAGELTWLGRLHAAYGYSSQGVHVYLARDLTPGPTHRETTESDMVHEWRSEADLRAMIGDSTFADAHSLAALALLDVRRAAGFGSRDGDVS